MFWNTKTPPRASMIKALAVAQPNSYNNRQIFTYYQIYFTNIITYFPEEKAKEIGFLIS
jgi:hypothetical protein